jgi:hypothetical protein
VPAGSSLFPRGSSAGGGGTFTLSVRIVRWRPRDLHSFRGDRPLAAAGPSLFPRGPSLVPARSSLFLRGSSAAGRGIFTLSAGTFARAGAIFVPSARIFHGRRQDLHSFCGDRPLEAAEPSLFPRGSSAAGRGTFTLSAGIVRWRPRDLHSFCGDRPLEAAEPSLFPRGSSAAGRGIFTLSAGTFARAGGIFALSAGIFRGRPRDLRSFGGELRWCRRDSMAAETPPMISERARRAPPSSRSSRSGYPGPPRACAR